jgi:GNAT superfamily N-acetyltransferase
MLLVDGRPIGHAALEIDPPKLKHEARHTAWLALMIGDDSLKGCGLGKKVIAHLEELAGKSGAERIEIGVFEFNHRALNFFRGRGYREFDRLPERAWWKGQMWADIRLLKNLA